MNLIFCNRVTKIMQRITPLNTISLVMLQMLHHHHIFFIFPGILYYQVTFAKRISWNKIVNLTKFTDIPNGTIVVIRPFNNQSNLDFKASNFSLFFFVLFPLLLYLNDNQHLPNSQYCCPFYIYLLNLNLVKMNILLLQFQYVPHLRWLAWLI